MAAQGGSDHDYKAHESTYARFMVLFKWGTIVSLLATAIVVLLISN